MRKRSGRQPRFAAVPNETIDDAASLDFMALGLLNVLLRHKDGWEITLSEIGTKYGYGRDAMANAMGLLQVARYVVKVRMMSKVGNQWSTEVCVYDTPATDAEVAALLRDVERDPDVRRAQIVPPTATALEHAGKRRQKLRPKRRQAPSVAVPRVPENPQSGATCENEDKDQVGPECRDSRQSGNPAVFKKTVGKKTGEKMNGGDGRRPSTGRGSSGGGGFAASKTSYPPVRSASASECSEVIKGIPQALVPLLEARWGDRGLPEGITELITNALHGERRTPQQLVERMARRWQGFRYEDALLSDEGVGIDRPVGVLVELLSASKCWGSNLDCEDGMDLVRGEQCDVCAVLIQQKRRAEGGTPHVPVADEAVRVPAPRSALPDPLQNCDRCDHAFRAPQRGLCPLCREEVEVSA